MFLRCLVPLFCLTSTALASPTVNKAAKTLQASIAKHQAENASMWNQYFMLDRLVKIKKIDVNLRDVLACRLDQTKNRPEFQAPLPSLAGFESLRRIIDEIKFTPKQIKDAGRGPGHSAVTCRPAKYSAKPTPDPEVKISKKGKVGPGARFGKAPFSIFQIRYWPFTPNKEGACKSPMLQASSSVNPKIKDNAVLQCRDLGFRTLEAFLQKPPQECIAMHQLGGPHVFNLTVASYQAGGKNKNCRMTGSLRQPWIYDRTKERPPWAPEYDRGFIMWPVEHFAAKTYQAKGLDRGISGVRRNGCRLPSRFDLVRFCAETLAEINGE